MTMCMASPPSPPKITMPPPPPPPAMRDEPEVDAAEFEMVDERSPRTASQNRNKYRKKSKGKSKSVSHSNYKGGGLNTV